ncbi:MAG: hypothetical protein V4719_00820 [Planctomycetota bacterium]
MPDKATQSLWGLLSPMLGEQAKGVTNMVLELRIDRPPQLTVIRNVTSLGDATEALTGKVFEVRELDLN